MLGYLNAYEVGNICLFGYKILHTGGYYLGTEPN